MSGEWWRERREARLREAMGDEMSEERWAEVEKFMKTHSPERIKRLEEVTEDRRDHLRRVIARRYEQIQQTREREPGMYELRLKRFQIEDQIFALSLQLKEENKSETAKALEGKLRAQVRALVENNMHERRVRLKQAKQRLEQAQAKLEQDNTDIDSIVEGHMKGIVEDDRWPTPGQPPVFGDRMPMDGPRGRGPGGPGGFDGPGRRLRGGPGGGPDGRFDPPATEPVEP